MGRIERSIEIAASPEAVFDYVSDHRRTTAYMKGLERWEPVGEQTQGVGARFDTALRVGPKSFESILEIDAWEPGQRISWTSVKGFRQTGTQLLEPVGQGTRMTFVFTYELPGGMAGRILAKTTEPVLQATVRDSMKTLKEQVEGTDAR